MHSFCDLKDYQRVAIELQIRNTASALMLDPGLGKTVCTLTSISALMDQMYLYGVLILAPLRVCATVWEQECDEWDHLPHPKFAHVYGALRKREAAMEQGGQIYLCNYENFPWLVTWIAENCINEGRPCPFQGIVFDELSKMANKMAERSRYLRALVSEPRCGIRWRTGLSATPASNGLGKLFGEYLALDDGLRLGTTKAGFEAQYFFFNYASGKLEPQYQAAERIFDKVKDITFAARATINMPEVVEHEIVVKLTDKERKIYKKLEEDFYVDVEAMRSLNPDAVTVATNDYAHTLNKCLQFSNGALYKSPDSREYVTIHDHKLNALEDLVDSLDGLPLLLAYQYNPADSERIRKRIPKAKEVRDFKDPAVMIEQWRAGDIPVLMGHPGSMGHGLNLQRHNHVCWFGLPWDLELWIQTNGRLERQGQHHDTVVQHRIMTRGTVDYLVMSALRRKELTQTGFLNLAIQYRQENE